MNKKTESEWLFEQFCTHHNIAFRPIPTCDQSTPDYSLTFGAKEIFVEVKQIDADTNFRNPARGGVSTRTVGDHIRQKINDSRKQIKVGATAGVPSVLLVYNNLDPLQMFGTDSQDFIAAIHGERTVVMKRGEVVDRYHGRNASFRPEFNTSFSAVGHLRTRGEQICIDLYENPYAVNGDLKLIQFS